LESLDAIKKETSINCNFLTWSGLRLAVSSFLRKDDDVRHVTKLSFFVMILSLTEVWPEIFSVKYCTNNLLKKIGVVPVERTFVHSVD